MFKSVDAEIIIIGAGIAGLTAAYTILEKEPSLNVLILESQARVGGRVHSVPLHVKHDSEDEVSMFEIGGHLILKGQGELIKFLGKLNIPVIPLRKSVSKNGKTIVCNESVAYFVKPGDEILNKFMSTQDRLELSKFVMKIETVCKYIKLTPDLKMISEMCSINLKNFVRKNVTSKNARAVIDHMVLTFCGVPSWEMSTMFYVFMCISYQGITYQIPSSKQFLNYYAIQGGTQKLCQVLLETIDSDCVLTNEQVIGIRSKSAHVEITTQNNCYTSYSVIVTAPPMDVLNIKFEPDLGQDRIDNLAGTANTTYITNFIITYEKAFWKNYGYCGDIYVFEKNKKLDIGPIHFCYDASQKGVAALSGRIVDNMGIKINDGDFKSAVLNELYVLFGDEALDPIDYYEKTWSETTSQMYCWGLNILSFLNVVCKSQHRVYWAGAETSSRWYGSIAGAMNSGIRAALEVLYDLRPAALSVDDIFLISPPSRQFGNALNQVLPNCQTNCWICYLLLVSTVMYLLWKWGRSSVEIKQRSA